MTMSAIDRCLEQVNRVIVGKAHEVRLAVACLLAQGHLLIEDIPGVGKTTLSHALARTLGLRYQRIQFTSDMLPADIIGVAVFERDAGTFRFHPGPIFAQLILADEVNRATPKTQSALLEAMEEHQVTAEGETRPLPEPFFVIATQNPMRQIGTFPLPESQLDRFLMRITLGFPAEVAERALLRGEDRRGMVANLEAALSPEELLELQRRARGVHVADPLLDYVQALLRHSREGAAFEVGLSPRAGLALIHAAQAWAMMAGRDAALPEDVQTVAPGVFSHRLRGAGELADAHGERLAQTLVAAVPVP